MKRQHQQHSSILLVSASTTTIDVVIRARQPHIERQSGSEPTQTSKAQQQISVVNGIRLKSKFYIKNKYEKKIYP